METKNTSSTGQMASLRGFSLTARIAGSILIGLALLWALLLLSGMEPQLGFLRGIASVERSLAFSLRRHLPARMGGHNLSHALVIIATLGLGRLLLSASERSRDKAAYLRFQNDYETWKREHKIEDNAAILSPVNQVLEEVRSGRLKDRDQLLKVFGATKKKLDEIGKDLAFLSIDVVDSTGLKSGEEKAAVEHDFREYKHLVEGVFQSHGSLKIAWTPDGAMCCFKTVDEAVAAAKSVLAALPDFNRRTKTLRRDFVVRCGVNAGHVYYDDAIPLEETSDRVLDIAAHLQHNAQPDSIALSRDTAKLSSAPASFASTGQTVHGLEVCEWRAP